MAGDPEARWRDLYDWLGTEADQMARLAAADGPAALALTWQAEELRHVRDHMRKADPTLPAQ
jgi:hypothetical protein